MVGDGGNEVHESSNGDIRRRKSNQQPVEIALLTLITDDGRQSAIELSIRDDPRFVNMQMLASKTHSFSKGTCIQGRVTDVPKSRLSCQRIWTASGRMMAESASRRRAGCQIQRVEVRVSKLDVAAVADALVDAQYCRKMEVIEARKLEWFPGSFRFEKSRSKLSGCCFVARIMLEYDRGRSLIGCQARRTIDFSAGL